MPDTPRAPFGFHALIGKTEDEARPFILQLLIQSAVWRAFGARGDPARSVAVYVVADDGFDDACSYTRALYIFRQEDAIWNPPREDVDGFWTFLQGPVTAEPLSVREWDTLVSLQGEALSGSGVCTIVGRANVQVEITNDRYQLPEVRLIDLEWLSGPEWEADRVSEEHHPPGFDSEG